MHNTISAELVQCSVGSIGLSLNKCKDKKKTATLIHHQVSLSRLLIRLQYLRFKPRTIGRYLPWIYREYVYTIHTSVTSSVSTEYRFEYILYLYVVF